MERLSPKKTHVANRQNGNTMKRILITTLWLGLSCLAAEDSSFPKLPDSPSKLIAILKGAGDRYTIGDVRVDYVKGSDLPYLVGLLDSKEPCGFVDMSISSIRYPGESTVGHEAAYLIDGFWKRYYPTDLTSQQYKPDIERIKLWYRMWSHLKKLAEDGAANGSQPIRSETDRTSSVDSNKDYHLVQSQIGDEVPMHGPVDSATVYVLVCPDQRLYVFRAVHSHRMEEAIKHFPRGSVLHYDGNALVAQPSQAQIEALSAF
jgi:hypothetical protein